MSERWWLWDVLQRFLSCTVQLFTFINLLRFYLVTRLSHHYPPQRQNSISTISPVNIPCNKKVPSLHQLFPAVHNFLLDNFRRTEERTIVNWLLYVFNLLQPTYSERRKYVKCLAKTKGRVHPKVSQEFLHKLRKFFRPYNFQFYDMTGHDHGWPDD